MKTVASPEVVETVVVGGGQMGLAASWYLTQAGREHVVLERSDGHGGAWRGRWDSFCLVIPNWSARLPGMPYDGPDPDGFMPRDEIVARLSRYAASFAAPVRFGADVGSLESANGSGFWLGTGDRAIVARNVIVATGGYQVPRIPAVGAELPGRLTQLSSDAYRNEAALPSGAVLVVGTGQSGAQIAEELHAAGRAVYLATGRAGRYPRRYRGRDIFHWIAQIAIRGAMVGVPMRTADSLPGPAARFGANPHLSGRDGGHEINLRRLAAGGVTLLGRAVGVDGERLHLAPDLAQNLEFADRYFDRILRPDVDRFIEAAGVDAPPDEREPFDFEPPAAEVLDLRAAGVSSVIWATGYRLDFGWIRMPIFDEFGYPRVTRGMAAVPGLAFLGLPWMHSQGSATLFGTTSDVPYVMERLLGVGAKAGAPTAAS